jgi:hypothetical protein
MREAMVALIAASLACQGCVLHLHARTNIVAGDATVPVSMSETVRDADGTLLFPDRLQLVGIYDDTFHAYNIPWGLIPLKPTTDISDSINHAVQRVHGDAVTELTIAASMCGAGWIFFWWVPVVPSCVRYRVHGHIVRVLPPTAVGDAR